MAIQKTKDAKPKIAILSRNFSKGAGGAENYAVNLAEQLADEFEFHVFCERSDVSHPAITIHCMGRNITRPRWIALWLFAWWSWRQTRQGFAIVHSHENTWHGDVHTAHVRPMRYSLFARASSPLGRFVACLKIITSLRLSAHLLLERLRFADRKNRIIISVAPHLSDIINLTFGINVERLRFVPPGIKLRPWLDASVPALTSKANARQAIGVPVEGWLLLFVGHNFEKKGLNAVLRSLPLLQTEISLLVVGGNPEQVDHWNLRCARQGLEGRVMFAGSLPDATVAFAAADCLVHATLDDTFAMVALEAMAINVPVILSVSPYCLYADAVSIAGAAWMLQDPHSEKQIVQAIDSLRCDTLLRHEQVARAAQFAHGHTWARVARMQAQIYQDLYCAKKI